MAGRLQTGQAAPGRAPGGGCGRRTAETKFLSVVDPDLFRVAGRLLWWISPDEALKDPMRLVAQVMSLGSWNDVETVERIWGEEVFRAVMDDAPPGLFTARRWNYWHVRLGRLPAPPLPRRSFA